MMSPTKNEYRESQGFIAEVVRTSRKKTADIRVEDGIVSIVVPRELSIERIDSLLLKKRQWIAEKLSVHKNAHPVREKDFCSGESFPYLGRNYRLKIEQGAYRPAKLVNGYLVVQVPENKDQAYIIRNALVRWYKRQAEQKLNQKVKRFASQIGVKPTDMRVRSFASRWGNCTSKGRIEFNWRVMLAPSSCVDYVAVHELCHLKHHDHSKRFWKEVERILPGYEAHKTWLKEHVHLLDF